MRYFHFTTFLVLIATSAFAQEEHTMDSKITDVTVFLTKAQVTRSAKTRIDAGKSSLVLSSVSSDLDAQSIQVKGNGNFVILGVQHRRNFLNEFNVPKKLKTLKDSLMIQQRALTLEQSRRDILNKEETMIISNQKVGGTQQNVSAAELKTMADFFRARLGEIADARLTSDEKIKKLNEKIARLNSQIQEETNTYQRNTGEIVINVSAEAAVSATFEVSYIVPNAGWNPLYDLRASDTRSPLHLNYKANVYQTTGEEWKGVKLTLSTSNPDLGGLKPELYTWYLDQQVQVYYDRRGAAADRKASMPAAMDAAGAEEAQSTANFVTTLQTTLNTQFEISLPYTIPSSDKPVVVDVQNLTVPAEYIYAAVPKLDPDAFLIAKATGWEQYNLLPGEISVFFEGTFVNKSYLDPASTGDTLSISLGRDKRIVIKRESVKDYTSKRIIGSNKRESHAWEISVRNTKQEPVKIRIEDQIPVSKNSQIEVTVNDTGGAQYNATTGKLTWELDLQPNETKKLSFRFEVKHPKDWNVSGL